VTLNAAAVVLESMPAMETRFGGEFELLETVSISIFVAEYLLRLWCCTEYTQFAHPIKGRLKFAVQPFPFIDFVAIVPGLAPGDLFLDLRYIRLFRLFRILRLVKVARYTRTMRTFTNVIEAKGTDLALIFMVLVLILVIASSSMYFVEHPAQPTVFRSIPAAMWWTIQTLTTVGYGDIVPVTPMGKFLGTLIALSGIGFFALPAGIMAEGFAEEIRRRSSPASVACPHCGKDVPTELIRAGGDRRAGGRTQPAGNATAG
jgi:voltage-gated potassium channel